VTAPEDRQARLASVRARLDELGLPALLVTDITNVCWLSGFTGSSGYVLLGPNRTIFATDSRYTEQARSECLGFELVTLETSGPDEVAGLLKGLRADCVGFEASRVSVHLHRLISEALRGVTTLEPTVDLIDQLRLVKSALEIRAIEAACAVADRAVAHVLPQLRPGVSERDLMLELEWFVRRTCGAEVAFPSIVLTGARTALPHGRPGQQKIAPGDFVLFDFGARVDGYCSDITRTFVVGRATDEQRRVYRVVHEALERSIAAVLPSAAGKDVDAVARDHIGAAGYGAYFGHGLGHSIGLAVHDGPTLGKRSATVLAPGMVTTVEPGIYLPHLGGVRIEQDLVVEREGPRVLTQASTELTEL